MKPEHRGEWIGYGPPDAAPRERAGRIWRGADGRRVYVIRRQVNGRRFEISTRAETLSVAALAHLYRAIEAGTTIKPEKRARLLAVIAAQLVKALELADHAAQRDEKVREPPSSGSSPSASGWPPDAPAAVRAAAGRG